MEFSWFNLKFGYGLLGYFFGQVGEAKVTLTTGGVATLPTLSLEPLILWPSIALWAVLSYLLGSLNFAILLSKVKYHDDIRKYGSGNAGMTNMLRVYGKGPALLTLAGDFLKGVAAVLLGLLLAGETCAYIAGFCCVLGHSFPIFSKFRGGKGVATTGAVILCLEPVVFLVCFVIFLIIVLYTKYVSLASIMSMLLYPLILNSLYFILHSQLSFTAHTPYSPLSIPLLMAILMMALVVFQHRSNIGRLYRGEESKTDLLRLVRKKKPEEKDG